MSQTSRLGARTLIALTAVTMSLMSMAGDIVVAHAQTKRASPATLEQQVSKLTNEGRYSEALPLAQRSLAILEKTYGPNHPKVVKALDNLALLYQMQSRYADADPLFKRELAIYEKALGPDHPNVGFSLGNLASLYREQGRYAEAEPLYKRLLT